MEGEEERRGSERWWDWEVLPLHLWEFIFSLLPVSGLIVCSAVCRSWLSTLRSVRFLSFYHSLPHPKQDLLFLLFSIPSSGTVPTAAAYHPIFDLWLPLSLPPFLRIHTSGGSRLLLEDPSGCLLTSNPFTSTAFRIPDMIPLHSTPYALALLGHSSSHYAIIAVSTSDRIRSQLYDSSVTRWVPTGELDLRVALITNATIARGGMLFCLSRSPDRLLKLDPGSGEWGVVDVAVPSLVCPHVVGFEGRLWLVGGVEELGEVCGIEVWEMEWGKGWREAGKMPEGLFLRFSRLDMSSFEVVDMRGIVCFCNASRGSIVLCDLGSMRWWRPAPCPFAVAMGKEEWLGHAVEPGVEMLFPADQRSTKAFFSILKQGTMRVPRRSSK